ncbi:MAG: DUF192 domain-containing protein [Phycisphaerae bacterium]|jgi:hypothetical protein|nr:DUF192 domain-containing protein [Phycisphaerae bacterium]
MDRSCRKLIFGVCLWLAALCVSPGIPGCRARARSGPPQVKIGSTVWDVDLAMTDDQRYLGMGKRAHLSESVGMLFMYPNARPRAYCMRDCLISLDIAYIDSDLRIVKIYTMPAEIDRLGRVIYPSIVPAQYALEVSAGAFARKGIREGDKVEFLGNIPPATKAAPGP